MLLGRHETDTATQLRSYAALSVYMLLLRPNASSGSTMDLVYDGSGNLANIDPWRSKKTPWIPCTEQKIVFFARCRPTTTNNQQATTKNKTTEYFCIFYTLITVYHCLSLLKYILHRFSTFGSGAGSPRTGTRRSAAGNSKLQFPASKSLKTGKLFQNWKPSEVFFAIFHAFSKVVDR